jgi:hypothetical protein
MNNAIMIADVPTAIHVIRMTLSAVEIQRAMSEVRGRCYHGSVVILINFVKKMSIVTKRIQIAFRK